MPIFDSSSPGGLLSNRNKAILKSYGSMAQHPGQVVLFGRGPNEGLMPSARDLVSFDSQKTHAKLISAFDQYKATTKDALGDVESRFKDSAHPALYKPETIPGQKFHMRTPDLNEEIPLFYADVDTEIPKTSAVEALDPERKAAVSTRLIAKRFLDAETGKSLFRDSNIGKASPTMQVQDMPVREMRAKAGTATLSRYSGEYIQKLYQHVVDLNKARMEQLAKQQTDAKKTDKEVPPPLAIHVIRPGRDKYATDCSTNILTVTTHSEITDSLNFLAKLHGQSNLIQFTDYKKLPGLARTQRTMGTAIDRLVWQGYYNTAEIRKGDQIVISDDHCQAGGTILGMAAAVKEAGGKVIAAVTPTAHPLGAQKVESCKAKFTLAPEVKTALMDTLVQWDPKNHILNKLMQCGMPLATLTNHEALIVIAYATDPADERAVAKFHQLESGLYNGQPKVLEGEKDSLEPVLNLKPLKAEEVALGMDMALERGRRITKPMLIKQVHVLDYDDLMTNEQSSIYQLMHNVFPTVAHNYRAHGPSDPTYLFFQHLAQAMEQKRGQYREGMPKLCMTQEQFAHTQIQENIEKKKLSKRKDTVTDLLQHLDALDPKLKAEYDALAKSVPTVEGAKTDTSTYVADRDKINNILWGEYKRQYQHMISAKPIQGKKSDVVVPFPHVAPTLMPGAQELLEKLRRPDHFVVLLSNKSESELEKEINKQGWAHYFDVISGKPNQLIQENGKYVTDTKFSKPKPYRLEQLITENPGLENAESWTFWGDNLKDGSQALPLVESGKLSADKVQWMLINPNPKLRQQAEEKVSEKPTLFQTIKIITANTLKNIPFPLPLMSSS